MNAIIVEKTIAYAGGFFKVNTKGQWCVQVFGTTGPGQTPHYSWMSIDADKVPTAVKKGAE